jgi:hypothetical protein
LHSSCSSRCVVCCTALTTQAHELACSTSIKHVCWPLDKSMQFHPHVASLCGALPLQLSDCQALAAR